MAAFHCCLSCRGRFSQRTKPTGIDQILTAALVHDLGKFVMGQFVKKNIDKIEAHASETRPFEQAERLVLGTDHAEIGVIILEKCFFPQELVMSVRWHHEPDSGENRSILVGIRPCSECVMPHDGNRSRKGGVAVYAVAIGDKAIRT